MLTLYTTPLSANGRKPLAVAHHLGLEIDVVNVDVYRGEGQQAEYLAINPTGKIPTLVADDFTLFESNAILIYLDEQYGNQVLCGSSTRERAEVFRWLFWEASQWQPQLIAALTPFVGHVLVNRAAEDPLSGAPAVDWQAPSLQPALHTLDSHLRSHPMSAPLTEGDGGHRHLAGAALSLADFSVAGMLTYFRKASFPFEDHPAIARWYQSIEKLESWQASADPLWD
jgi:glutathione S-transferase